MNCLRPGGSKGFNVKTLEVLCKSLMMMIMNCCCSIADRRKAFTPYFQPGSLSEILIIANLRHTTNRVEPAQNLSSDIVECSSDNHYNTALRYLLFCTINVSFTSFNGTFMQII